MEISLINKPKVLQPRPSSEAPQQTKPAEGDKSVTNRSKTDSSEISGTHAGIFDDKRLAVAKSSVLSEIANPTPQSRLDELKSKIADGSYYVSDEDLADAILG
jgi:anti-sigma28 factor (negative regulator of flagellin synthesis)